MEPPATHARPLDELRAALERALGGLAAQRILVLTHRSPDPDALGALVGTAFLLEGAFGLVPEIATIGRIFRAENLAMVRELALDFAAYGELEPGHYAGAVLVDSQPAFGHTVLPDGVPILAVFDHHQKPVLREPAHLVAHEDVRLGVGATSSIVYEYLRDAGLVLDVRTATALCLGVRFDTADLSMHATALDQEAFLETFARADKTRLAHIRNPDLPPAYYRELGRALQRSRVHGPLVWGLLGRVQNPESVAELADFFLRREGCEWALVGGAFETTYHLSLPTDPAKIEAYPLMERLLEGEGSFGGRGAVAGGQLTLAGTDLAELFALERRLRRAVLKLVPKERLSRGAPRQGARLTRTE
jgi:nanoRNase/pAp phosphatase (c-di-AMP/oligoRNAs hydrolase)